MGNEVELRTGLYLTRHQVAQLGVFGVLREALNLCYRSPLPSIQLTIVLPYFAFNFLARFFLSQIMASNIPYLLTMYQPESKGPSMPGAEHMSWWLGLLFFALMVFTFCVTPLVTAAVYSAVGSIYSGNFNVTLTQILKTVPRLWKRILVVAVYEILLYFAVLFVSSTMFILYLTFQNSSRATPLLLLLGFLCFIPLWIINIWSYVAIPVTCYEESYGWAAYKQSKKLLSKRWGSGTLLLFIVAIPGTILFLLQGSPPKSFKWTYLLSSMVFTVVTSLLYQFICVAWAVFYFSSAEKHHETQVTHDTEAGYQPIATDQPVL